MMGNEPGSALTASPGSAVASSMTMLTTWPLRTTLLVLQRTPSSMMPSSTTFARRTVASLTSMARRSTASTVSPSKGGLTVWARRRGCFAGSAALMLSGTPFLGLRGGVTRPLHGLPSSCGEMSARASLDASALVAVREIIPRTRFCYDCMARKRFTKR